jgi:D-serine deaminase-like pyridoxal phosphate-dependent protein
MKATELIVSPRLKYIRNSELYSEEMATSSFYEMMVIDTPEAARALEQAFREADRRGPLNFDHIRTEIDELLRTGRAAIDMNSDWLKETAFEEPYEL